MAERLTRPPTPRIKPPATTKPPGWPDDVTLGSLPTGEHLIVHARYLGTRIDTRGLAADIVLRQLASAAGLTFAFRYGVAVTFCTAIDSTMPALDMALLAHVHQTSGSARAVVWAHNSHLGDARATQMGEGGELNLGQLVRQKYGPQAFLVGFTTHTGTVTAASNWEEQAQRKRVRPSMAGSYERLFHDVGMDRFLLLCERGLSERRCARSDSNARLASSTVRSPSV